MTKKSLQKKETKSYTLGVAMTPTLHRDCRRAAEKDQRILSDWIRIKLQQAVNEDLAK